MATQPSSSRTAASRSVSPGGAGIRCQTLRVSAVARQCALPPAAPATGTATSAPVTTNAAATRRMRARMSLAPGAPTSWLARVRHGGGRRAGSQRLAQLLALDGLLDLQQVGQRGHDVAMRLDRLLGDRERIADERPDLLVEQGQGVRRDVLKPVEVSAKEHLGVLLRDPHRA